MSKIGALVAYKSKPAKVVSATTHKYEITFSDGTSQKVREKDFRFIHPEFSTINQDCPDVDASILFDLDAESFPLQEITEWLFDDFTPQSAWYVYLMSEDSLYFYWNKDLLVLRTQEQIQSIKNQRKDKALETILSAPKKQANTTEKVDAVIKKHKTFDNYVKNTEIECQTARDKSIFVDYQGKVWPCCWQGHYYSKIGHDSATPTRIQDNKNMWERYGEGFNDLANHGIFDILKTPYFNNDLVDSWKTGSDNRLWICGKTCGKELDFRGNGEQNFEDTEMNEYAKE